MKLTTHLCLVLRLRMNLILSFKNLGVQMPEVSRVSEIHCTIFMLPYMQSGCISIVLWLVRRILLPHFLYIFYRIMPVPRPQEQIAVIHTSWVCYIQSSACSCHKSTLHLHYMRGGVVVKALRYKPSGHGFDSRWCHWNLSVT
jgi:hypothetical protein